MLRHNLSELNGSDFVAVPFESCGDSAAGRMEIGYIVKKNLILSGMGEMYVRELNRYLSLHSAKCED